MIRIQDLLCVLIIARMGLVSPARHGLQLPLRATLNNPSSAGHVG